MSRPHIWHVSLFFWCKRLQKSRVVTGVVTVVGVGLQNFFRSYKKLAGMTGTAETESSEFQNIYNLPVTVVPTNQKVRRTDESDVVFRTEEGTIMYWACILEACKVAD